jgi:hypothetical protein
MGERALKLTAFDVLVDQAVVKAKARKAAQTASSKDVLDDCLVAFVDGVAVPAEWRASPESLKKEVLNRSRKYLELDRRYVPRTRGDELEIK